MQADRRRARRPAVGIVLREERCRQQVLSITRAGSAERRVLADMLNIIAERVIPNSGHWLMEEQPAATVAAIRVFLDQKR